MLCATQNIESFTSLLSELLRIQKSKSCELVQFKIIFAFIFKCAHKLLTIIFALALQSSYMLI